MYKMRSGLVLLIIVVLLVSCGPPSFYNPQPREVRIVISQAQMFRGSIDSIYNNVIALIPRDTHCFEIDTALLDIRGGAIKVGYLECGHHTGWVIGNQYRHIVGDSNPASP